MPFSAARLLRSAILSAALLATMAEGAGLYFNNVFPQKEPGSATGWKTVNAFPNLSFVDPLWITDLPGSNEVLVLLKGGQILRFANDAAVTTAQISPVLDIADRLQMATEMGLLRMVFHPQFGQANSPHANDVFLCYSHRPPGTEASVQHNMWRVSRFKWQPATKTIDPASEEVLIQQYDPDGWHNAGILTFDKDGFLLISAGDGGSANDYYQLSQKLDFGLFGGILRIDVDNDPNRSHPIRRQPLDLIERKPAGYPASFTQGYGIPNDNPWQDPGGSVLEEYFALGLRSPHSGHYDPVEQELWVADVGQNSVEELNRIRRSGNYGWGASPVVHGVVTPPFLSYTHGSERCIIGGLRYRGAKWAKELTGKILIGDNIAATLSTVTLQNAPATPVRTQILFNLGGSLYSGLANICTDSAGEIYLPILNGTGMNGGRILKLDKTGSTAQPPQFLSQTGLFVDLPTLQPHPDLIPYTVANPLWSDGAEKKRWVMRAGSRPNLQANRTWTFPNGSVLVKHFSMPTDERHPGTHRKLETRVMIQTSEGGKYGLTYKWNAAGTDAELISDGAEEDIPVILADGTSTIKHWSYPSRSDCKTCHTDQTGFAIGFRTHQLNIKIPHPQTGLQVDQLSYLSGVSAVVATNSRWEGTLRGAALDDETMPLEHRVRSYLDSNCSHCHQPGTGTAFFDARLETSLALQNLIDAPLTGHYSLGPDGRYIKPGDALLSALHVRGSSTVPGEAMPPLGRHIVDQQAMDLLQEYIESITPAEFAHQPTPRARYFRLLTPQAGTVTIAELGLLDGRGFPIPSSMVNPGEVSGGINSRGSVLDGNSLTYWSSNAGPHFITLDLGAVREVGGYLYTPGNLANRIGAFEIQLSANGTDWIMVHSGSFPAIATAQRYDHLLKPRETRTEILVPPSSRGLFQATLILDRSVNDLTLDDFVVTGGTASNLRGTGYYYTVDITPSPLNGPGFVQISLPENAVNSSALGSRATSASTQTLDNMPPVASVGQPTTSMTGLYTVDLTFSEPVTGLETGDFSLSNGQVISVSGSGMSYTILIQEDHPSGTGFSFAPDAVQDLSGLGNVQGDYHYLDQDSWFLVSQSIYRTIYRSGFHGAEGGYYENDGLWPYDDRNGDISASPDYKVTFRFRLPHAGVYIFQAETLAFGEDYNSFHIGVDGGTPRIWNTNRNPGEIGSGEFHLGTAGETGDYQYHLSAGEHTVEIYGREPGTRFRVPELVPLRSLPLWWGDQDQFREAPFFARLHFTRPITGLDASDFEVTGATILRLNPDGRDYYVELQPTAREIFIRLPADRAQNEGQGNLASLERRFLYISPYEDWAAFQDISWGPAHHLQDDDRDGIPLLLEYAFGMDPKKTAVHELNDKTLPTFATVEVDGIPRLTMQFNRRKNSGGIRYIPQFSGDGQVWENATNPPALLLDSGEWEKVSVPDHGTGSKRFGRVKIEPFGP